jgi:hypothetical protein
MQHAPFFLLIVNQEPLSLSIVRGAVLYGQEDFGAENMAGVDIENLIDSMCVHATANCRESSREYLSSMLRRESNSCQLAFSECCENAGPVRILKVLNIRLHV